MNEPIKITDLLSHPSNEGTQRPTFEVATAIVDEMSIDFRGYEKLLFTANSYELFEFVYATVHAAEVRINSMNNVK